MVSSHQCDTEITSLWRGVDFLPHDDVNPPPSSFKKTSPVRKKEISITLALGIVTFIWGLAFLLKNNTEKSSLITTNYIATHDLSKNIVDHLGHHNKNKKKKGLRAKDLSIWNDVNDDQTVSFLSTWSPPPTESRCEFVMNEFAIRDAGTPPEDLKERHLSQSVDPNVFYRATAHLFWKDFAGGKWDDDFGGMWSQNFTGTFLLHNDPDSNEDDDEESVLLDQHDPNNIQQLDGVDLTAKSVWTWVTGDQHLSNYGAWRNRHGDVVFSVNDFDEAANFNFQVDVIRIAVSIYSHAISNGLTDDEVDRALMVFTESYVQTVLNCQDNEKALTHELTPKTAHGKLGKFLKKIEHKKSHKKLMVKFTTHDPVTHRRHFIKEPIDEPHNETRLASVAPKMEAEIIKAFAKARCGATMMKLGHAVPEWDDDFFQVVDVAERVGSGIGSHGVDRHFVLLNCHNQRSVRDDQDGSAIILDVKCQPTSAVTRSLNEENAAWCGALFPNEAARVVEAQRRLTSCTDPFAGWVTLPNLDPNSATFALGEHRPFSVRQRGPWKASPNLEDFDQPGDFNAFVSQIAAATATSHVRGSVAKAPADFKHVTAAVLRGSEHKRIGWGKMMATIAHAYRKQVLLDFECFQNFVKGHYQEEPEVR